MFDDSQTLTERGTAVAKDFFTRQRVPIQFTNYFILILTREGIAGRDPRVLLPDLALRGPLALLVLRLAQGLYLLRPNFSPFELQ